MNTAERAIAAAEAFLNGGPPMSFGATMVLIAVPVLETFGAVRSQRASRAAHLIERINARKGGAQ
jgi:hypothetical protein